MPPDNSSAAPDAMLMPAFVAPRSAIPTAELWSAVTIPWVIVADPVNVLATAGFSTNRLILVMLLVGVAVPVLIRPAGYGAPSAMLAVMVRSLDAGVSAMVNVRNAPLRVLDISRAMLPEMVAPVEAVIPGKALTVTLLAMARRFAPVMIAAELEPPATRIA